MDVKTEWNLTMELLERAYWLREFTHDRLKYPIYSDYRPLFTTQDDWTIIKYIMEVLTPFCYWTLWMSKRHRVTVHHIIMVYNRMFDHMDGVMWAVAQKKTEWKEDLYFAVKFVRQKLSKYHAEVTPMTGMLLISAAIFDPFRKLWSFRKWDKAMDINPEDETFYTTQYQGALVNNVNNEYCAKHRRMYIIKPDNVPDRNHLPSGKASGFGQLSVDRYDLCTDDEEYLTPESVAESTPRWRHGAAHLLNAGRLYLNPTPEAPTNWGQVNPNHNAYHSDPIEISCTVWLPDITDWRCQQQEMHTKYADLSNVACDIFSIIPQGVWVEASFSLGRDVVSWRHSKTTGKTLREKVVVKLFAWTNNKILAGE